MRGLKRLFKNTKNYFAVLLLIFSQLLVPMAIMTTPAAATIEDPDPPEKIIICHRDNNVKKPYQSIEVDYDAVDGVGDDDHSHHTGPVATSEAVAQYLKDNKIKWGDIIPGILNWDEDGKKIWRNDCAYPKTATIELTKALPTHGDPGLFDLNIIRKEALWGWEAVDVGDGGTTGKHIVKTGKNVIVAERDGTDTSLKDYATSVECRDRGGQGEVIADGTPTGKDTRQLMIKKKKIKPGSDIVCTFTNTHLSPVGTIIIEKQTNPDKDPTKFYFESDIGKTNTDFSLADDDQMVFSDIDTGVYSVTEKVQPNWKLEKATCDDGSDPSKIDLGVGETVTCTFENTYIPPGTIIIEKQTDPDKDPTLFKFNTNIGNNTVVMLADDQNVTFSDLEPATYSVAEEAKAGWELESATCDDGSDPSAIDLESGETVKCIFENDREPVTVYASKIVCTDESELPNWGSGGPDITAQTAIDWVDKHESCSFVEGWDFEWGFAPLENPGDNTGDSSLKNFGPTDSSGQTSTDIDELGDATQLWFREVWQNGYLGFTGVNRTQDVSAEFYCNNDVLNYDNWDWIRNPQYGQSYHCVAWNVPLAQGEIKVHKFEDIDGDGLRDIVGHFGSGPIYEPGLENWEFALYDASDAQVGTPQTTDSEGWTTFDKLIPGDYTVCEVNQTGWVNTLPGAATVTDPEGLDRPCVELTVSFGDEAPQQAIFGNYEEGQIIVKKYNDLNRNGERDSGEPFLRRWQFVLYDSEGLQVREMRRTNGQGRADFNRLEPGEYKVCEKLRGGWASSDLDLLKAFTGNNPGEVCKTVIVESGGHDGKIFFGNYEDKGSLDVLKFNDVNRNGFWDEGEPTLEGWEIELYKQGVTNGVYASELKTLTLTPNVLFDTKTTDANGLADFGEVRSGFYFVDEVLQEGWRQTGAYCGYLDGPPIPEDATFQQVLESDRREVMDFNSTGVPVVIGAGQDVHCFIGNARAPQLLLAKGNDTPNPVQVGHEVGFTITVTNPELSGMLYDVKVFDVLQHGFEYTGSWSASSSRAGHVGMTLSHAYASPGIWDLGTMYPGEVISLTYSATIGEVVDGQYPDVAFAAGYDDPEEGMRIFSNCGIENTKCQSGELLAAETPFVGTDVEVYSEEEGEVLGLQKTGVPAILPAILGTAVAVTALLAGSGGDKKRKWNLMKLWNKSIAMLLVGFIGFAMFGLMSTPAYAIEAKNSAYWTFNVSEPEINQETHTINADFQVLSTDKSDTFDVDLLVNGAIEQSQDNLASGALGDSGTFSITLPNEGIYTLKLAVTNNGDVDPYRESNELTVIFDETNPIAPGLDEVVRVGDQYTLRFQAPSSTDVSKIRVYASTDPDNFVVDVSTLVATIDTTPGQIHGYVYNAPTSERHYFVIAAEDTSGNTSEATGEVIPTTTSAETAVPVTTAAAEEGVVAAADDETAQAESGVEGATDEATTTETDNDATNVAWMVAIILGVMAIGYIGFKMFGRKNEDSLE